MKYDLALHQVKAALKDAIALIEELKSKISAGQKKTVYDIGNGFWAESDAYSLGRKAILIIPDEKPKQPDDSPRDVPGAH